MTNTRIEISFNKVGRLADLEDLAEILFPGNRNQQHAFLVVWLALKWRPGIVPNLADAAAPHSVSRRTLERVRAKLRRLGLIEHVSRFSARHGYRDGWILSARFERSLRQLAAQVAALKDTQAGSHEKDQMLVGLAAVRRAATLKRPQIEESRDGGDRS
ncbi:MAG: hypothetical protein WCK89_23750 [bacterium]